MDPTQYLPVGTHGAGTAAAEGWKLFHRHADAIRNSVSRRIEHLFQEIDLTYPLWFGPSQEIVFWLIAGCGGTSGGTLQPAIALCHDLDREFKVKEGGIGPSRSIGARRSDAPFSPFPRPRRRNKGDLRSGQVARSPDRAALGTVLAQLDSDQRPP
jgi:hypothetical protein